MLADLDPNKPQQANASNSSEAQQKNKEATAAALARPPCKYIEVAPAPSDWKTGTRYQIYHSFADRLVAQYPNYTQAEYTQIFKKVIELVVANFSPTKNVVEFFKVEDELQKLYGAESHPYLIFSAETMFTQLKSSGTVEVIFLGDAQRKPYKPILLIPDDAQGNLIFRHFVAMMIAKQRTRFDKSTIEPVFTSLFTRINTTVAACQFLDLDKLLADFGKEYLPGTLAHQTLLEIINDSFIKQKLRDARK